MPRPRRPLAILALALAIATTAPSAHADAYNRFDLAGAYPGLSGQATASFLAHNMPGWVLASDGGDKSFTDAVANDCAPTGRRLWTCEATLRGASGADPTFIEMQARYATPTDADKDKKLIRFRLRLSWSAHSENAWREFMGSRPAPDMASALARAKALKAFEDSPGSLLAAQEAKSFKAALWRLKAPDGTRFELAAVGAFDAKGRLAALATQSSEPTPQAPAARAPTP